MSSSQYGRNCARCNKEVIDLTGHEPIDLIALLRERSTPVCGRVKKDQVFRYAQLPEVMIFKPYRTAQRSSPVLPWLAVGGLLLTACTNAARPTEPVAPSAFPDTPQAPPAPHDGPLEEVANPDTSKTTNAKPENSSAPEIDQHFLEGDIALGGIDGEAPSTWYSEVPEVPAAFPGGYDSLMAFVRGNLHFPEQEAQAGMSGTVVVSFKIDEEGRPIEASVIKDVPGSVNFGLEVLRMIASMPPWSPALHDGKPMMSQLSLPVRFSK